VEVLGAKPNRPVEGFDLGDEKLLSLDMQAAAEHFEADLASIPAARRRLVTQ
jgi:hypothetical protein